MMMTMKSRILGFAALAAIVCALPACDYAQRKEIKDERADRHYQAAMSDYAAGRLDAAISGFEKALKANPGNASARFQLACLLQDRRKDYLGALCHYREFLALEGGGDKAKMAKDRAALCEKLFAVEIAKKAGAAGIVSAQEHEDVLAAAKAASNALAKAEKRIEELAGRVEGLESENARLRRMMASVGDEKSARGSARPSVASARELLDDDDDGEGDRLRLSPEAKALFEEDELADSPSALGARAVASSYDGPTLAHSADMLPGSDGAKASEPQHEARPEYYTVQEGDTLYRIALRFYGRRDAWKRIQEANKATVSSDARIKVGQKIRLP